MEITWGLVNPLLSNKVVYNKKITPVEDGKIIKNDKNTASMKTEPVSPNIGDPLMKAIVKYRLHPSIVAIKKNRNSGFSFSFSQVERDEIMKEINNLKANKATQSTDIPTKLIKGNSDIFWRFYFWKL